MFQKLLSTENYFLKTILTLIAISLLHFVAFGFNSELPFALLYGPTLYYVHVNLKGKKMSGVLVFLILSYIGALVVWYVFLRVNGTSADEIVRSYHSVYYASAAIFDFGFGVLILRQRNKWVKPVSYLKSSLIYQLAAICIIISFVTILYLLNVWYHVDLDFNPFYMAYMIMVLALFLLIRYVYQDVSWEMESNSEAAIRKRELSLNGAQKVTYSLSTELLEDYAERLEKSLLSDKLYLRSGLSIELLAQEIEIPKHHLSELLNAYLGKSFYYLIAEYRIDTAREMLERCGDHFTIEALSHECGFNSKTSFNKYFKEFMGCSPSEYRDGYLKRNSQVL